MATKSIDSDIRDTFWKAFAASPCIMMKIAGSAGRAEPMTAHLDKDAHHAIWFFCKRSNRIGGGGQATGEVMTLEHSVFASIDGTLVEEADPALRDKHWSNTVEAWFPKGRSDPSVVMLRFDITDGEVWTAEMGLKGAFKLFTGKPLDAEDVGVHAFGAV